MLQELDVYTRVALDVVGAEGCELVLRDGARVLDLYGGHCVNTLGAGDPGLGAVIAEQWQRLSFVTNVLDHPARHEFAVAGIDLYREGAPVVPEPGTAALLLLGATGAVIGTARRRRNDE